MPTNSTVASLTSKLTKLEKEREHHVQAIREIDAVFARLGGKIGGGASIGRAGRAAGGSGSRAQGVKAALLGSLTDKGQSPDELAAKVSRKVGAKVNITTQLAMLKAEKKARNPKRGQWVKA